MAGVMSVRTGDLLEITFCRPERRNALGAEEWSILDTAIAQAENDLACEFVLLRGAGDFFCAGVDLKAIERAAPSGGLLAMIEANSAILQRLERLPQIVIASLNGPAVGIGTHIALCADVVFAVDTAYFRIPEAGLGIPDVLHFAMLEQRLGRAAAFSMLLLGNKLSAVDAASCGVIANLFGDQKRLQAGVGDYLSKLRAVRAPIRTAFKRHAASLRADPAAQLAASAHVLDRGNIA